MTGPGLERDLRQALDLGQVAGGRHQHELVGADLGERGEGGPHRLGSTLVGSPIVLVAPAAAASATVSITPGWAMRPIVPTVAKPACSAGAAQAGMTVGSTSRTWLGSPMPILISAQLLGVEVESSIVIVIDCITR